MKTDKLILDACCGGRTFWFDKNHPDALYIDIRSLPRGFVEARPNFNVNPDVEMDFRDLSFADETFQLVVWDPPHIARKNNKSWIQQKYGMLDPDTWARDLKQGFEECFRVLRDHGILIFKWSESQISLKQVLASFHTAPLFGHTTGKSGTTKWLCFMKNKKSDGEE